MAHRKTFQFSTRLMSATFWGVCGLSLATVISLTACVSQQLDSADSIDELLATPTNVKGESLRTLGFTSGAVDTALGVPVYLSGRIPASIQRGEDARTFLRNHLAQSFRLATASDFELRSERTDEQGHRYIKLRQLHAGVPVEQGEVVVQVAEDGAVLSVLGRPLPQLSLSTHAQLSGNVALNRALDRLAKAGERKIHEQPKLMIFTSSEGRPALAYHAAVEYQGQEGTALEDLYVDASSGAVLAQVSRIHTGLSRTIYDGKNACLSTGSELPGTLLFSEGGSSTNASAQAAYNNTGTTYAFYKNFFGRDSYDNAGAPLVSSVNFQFSTGFSCTGANAAWLGDPYKQMVYGEGDTSTFKPLALSLDVTAHELTHAVTNLTSNLTYRDESGALNEAMSDIFGNVTEAWKASGGTATSNPASITASAKTWKVGEEIAKPGLAGGALRFMNNPTADSYSKDYYPERITGTSDNGGVHGNSGIANLAFYLLSQGGTHPRGKTTGAVTGIGIAKAAQIFYTANTSLLTSSATFLDARNATAQAAKTAFGDCSAEWQNTHKAWDAVGVPGTWTRCGTGDTQAPTVSISAPTAGSTVSGTSVTVSASAMDNVGVTSVEFYRGTALIATDTTAPYAVTWDSTSAANGSYAITAKAKDAAGNVGTSSAVSVTVNNSGGGTTQNEAEPNGSFAQANTVSTKGTTVSGFVSSSTDKDYFKVMVPAGATLSAVLTPPATSDFDLYVFNAAQTQVAKSTKGTGLVDSASVKNTGAAQYYYIHVIAYSGASTTNGYKLKLTW